MRRSEELLIIAQLVPRSESGIRPQEITWRCHTTVEGGARRPHLAIFLHREVLALLISAFAGAG